MIKLKLLSLYLPFVFFNVINCKTEIVSFSIFSSNLDRNTFIIQVYEDNKMCSQIGKRDIHKELANDNVYLVDLDNFSQVKLNKSQLLSISEIVNKINSYGNYRDDDLLEDANSIIIKTQKNIWRLIYEKINNKKYPLEVQNLAEQLMQKLLELSPLKIEVIPGVGAIQQQDIK